MNPKKLLPSENPTLPVVYITKYAMTTGILVATNAEHCVSVSEKMISVRPEGRGVPSHYHKPFWHITLEEAQAHAETLRKAKIESVKKQLARLEKLGFAKTKPHG